MPRRTAGPDPDEPSAAPTTVEADASLARHRVRAGVLLAMLALLFTMYASSFPGMTEWHIDSGAVMYGEDQEVWSPDRLGRELTALNT